MFCHDTWIWSVLNGMRCRHNQCLKASSLPFTNDKWKKKERIKPYCLRSYIHSPGDIQKVPVMVYFNIFCWDNADWDLILVSGQIWRQCENIIMKWSEITKGFFVTRKRENLERDSPFNLTVKKIILYNFNSKSKLLSVKML